MGNVSHPDYPEDFPKPTDTSLFGEHTDRYGRTINVSEHEHGYALYFGDGTIITVAGDRPDTVRRYLSGEGGIFVL